MSSRPAMLWILVVSIASSSVERRDNSRDALGEHRFAGAGRTNHQDIVTAGDGYLDRALDVALAFDVAEIDVVILMRREKFAEISRVWAAIATSPRKNCECLPQIVHAVYVDLVHHRGFERICFGHEQRAFPAASRLERNRQHAFHGANGTVERQFADKSKIFEWRAVDFLRSRRSFQAQSADRSSVLPF